MCRELFNDQYVHVMRFLFFKPLLESTRVSEARETDQAIDLQDRAILLFAVHWSQIGHGVMFLVDFAFRSFQVLDSSLADVLFYRNSHTNCLSTFPPIFLFGWSRLQKMSCKHRGLQYCVYREFVWHDIFPRHDI